ALVERGHKRRKVIGRRGAKESDHRHRGLLRPRRKRPRRYSAADQRNELPPSHAGHGRSLLRDCRSVSLPPGWRVGPWGMNCSEPGLPMVRQDVSPASPVFSYLTNRLRQRALEDEAIANRRPLT